MTAYRFLGMNFYVILFCEDLKLWKEYMYKLKLGMNQELYMLYYVPGMN